MWNWFNCYLSGRHDYSAWCESGAMFLRCVHCGRRSAGWAVTEDGATRTPPQRQAERAAVGRVLPTHAPRQAGHPEHGPLTAPAG